jgi:hypothetical protein
MERRVREGLILRITEFKNNIQMQDQCFSLYSKAQY